MKLFSLIIFSFAYTASAYTANCDQTPNTTQQLTQPAPLLPGCSALAPQESAFASSLSAMHQALFCYCFGTDQRAQAMSYISSSAMNKTTGMTNDMAVEMTLKNSRGMMNLPASSPIILQQQAPSTPNPANGQTPSQPTPKKRSSCSKN
jgi:hypothetical protein